MNKFATAALLIACLPHLARADGDYFSPTNERVRASLGIMRLSNTTTFQADSSTGVPGTVINGEDQFGLGASNYEPKFQVMVRAAVRSRMWLDYFSLDRSGGTTVAQPILFRDAVLQTGDPLQSLLDLRMLGLTYGYSVWHTEKFEIAPTIGVTSVQITAQAKVTSPTQHINQREDVAGPYPTPGIATTWVISRRWYFDSRFQYLSLTVNHLEGSLQTMEFDALYRWRPNVSFAVGYTGVKARLSSNDPKNGGFFDFDSKGPQFFVRVAF